MGPVLPQNSLGNKLLLPNTDGNHTARRDWGYKAPINLGTLIPLRKPTRSAAISVVEYHSDLGGPWKSPENPSLSPHHAPNLIGIVQDLRGIYSIEAEV